MKYRLKPFETTAYPWYGNGDHPDDKVGETVQSPTGEQYTRLEGAVVRLFRHPGFPGNERHVCGHRWHDHGWIDEADETVCPGMMIVDSPEGRFALTREDFDAHFEPVDE